MNVTPHSSSSIKKNSIINIDECYGKDSFSSEDIHIIAKPEASEVKEYRARLPIFNKISFTRIYKGNDPSNVLLLTGGFGGTRGGFIDAGFVKSLIGHWPPEQKRPDVVYVHWPHHKAPPPFKIDPDFKKLIPFMQSSLENATNTFPPLQRKKLTLVNHSLGSPLMHAVVAKSPALQNKVTCFFDIAPAFNGPKSWLEKLIRWTPLRFKGLLGNFIKDKNFSDTKQEYQKSYQKQPAPSYSLTSPDDVFIHPHSPHWSSNNIPFVRSPAKESGLAYSRMDGTHRSIIDQTAGHWVADIFRSNHLAHETETSRGDQSYDTSLALQQNRSEGKRNENIWNDKTSDYKFPSKYQLWSHKENDKINTDVMVFIHGFSKDPSVFDTIVPYLKPNLPNCNMYSIGYPSTKSMDFFARDPKIANISQNISDIIKKLPEIKHDNPKENLHLVGTSMGGLILRTLTIEPKHIATRGLFGVPNLGTKSASDPFGVPGLGKYLKKQLRDMSPESTFLKSIKDAHLKNKTYVGIISKDEIVTKESALAVKYYDGKIIRADTYLDKELDYLKKHGHHLGMLTCGAQNIAGYIVANVNSAAQRKAAQQTTGKRGPAKTTRPAPYEEPATMNVYALNKKTRQAPHLE